MSTAATRLSDRAERYTPHPHQTLSVSINDVPAKLKDISRSGLACTFVESSVTLSPGTTLDSIQLRLGTDVVECGSARVARTTTASRDDDDCVVGIHFDREQPQAIRRLLKSLRPYAYVTEELADVAPRTVAPHFDATEHTLDQFHQQDDPDVFAKCRTFGSWIADMQHKQLYQRSYRVTLTGAIDNRVTIFDPITRTERAMLCFDSNSYLGLHRHPRVVEEVSKVVKLVGYGTPSAQLLCGTNRYLRELEDALCEFHGREAAIVFPTGFAANIGTIHALVRNSDAVVRDQYAHASIHEGCRTSSARFTRIFGHNSPQSLERLLTRAEASGCSGKLVVTDGVFSMHGRIAPLPQLVDVCRKHNARLMIDDAHGVGVIGPNGKGIEEHHGMQGSVDVLMGTLSKALGCVGGYVAGDADLISYLRWFAPSGLFTTALPAAMCAGVKVALGLVTSEPEHRLKLWQNIAAFAPALRDAGFIVSDAVSPIVTVFMGAQPLLWEVSRELFEAGIKCGNVIYPAVGKSDCILRFTMNSRHTPEDLTYAVDTLTRLGKKYGILGRTREEIQEIGRALKAAPHKDRLVIANDTETDNAHVPARGIPDGELARTCHQ